MVSTHYMDEAERCHDIAYIFNGDLIARGTGDELIAQSGLVTFEADGPRADRLIGELEKAPGVEMVAPFGQTLHVSGTDRRALEAAIQPYRRDPYRWREVRADAGGRVHPPDARIRRPHGGRSGMNGISLSRILAVLQKEFTQLLRDRLTYAMMLGIPVIQLLLFGYAINSDPKQLPTAVLVQDQGHFSRSVLGALENSEYFSIDHVARSPAEMDELIERGAVQFAITIPGDFTRRVVRRDKPQILVEADASDPAATGPATSALAALPDRGAEA